MAEMVVFLRKCGRGERIRTSDPLVPNQVRYQAAPRPDNQGFKKAAD
jgi:hypothetical protein